MNGSFRRFLEEDVGGILKNVRTTRDGQEFVLTGTKKPVSDQELAHLVERFYGHKVITRGSLRITVRSPNSSLFILITMTNLTGYRESPLLGVRVTRVGKGLRRAV